MNILVTGGAGFIGSHLAQRLLTMGHTVWTLDNLSSGTRSTVSELNASERHIFIEASVAERAVVKRLIGSCDVVFHLAALLGVKNTVENPLEVINGTLEGTKNVLELAYDEKRKVIFASTSEIYGKNASLPFVEDTSDRVFGPASVNRWSYASAKALSEHLCYAYAHKGLPITIVRYFNTYGPRQSTYYGGVIAKFVSAAMRNEPLFVHGDGQQTRCFTYVDDAVQGTILAMSNRGNGLAFNIGSDEPVTIEHLAKLIRRVAKSTSQIQRVSYEQVYGAGFEDMRARVPDLTRSHDVLGYQSSVGLEEGVERTIDWYHKKERIK